MFERDPGYPPREPLDSTPVDPVTEPPAVVRDPAGVPTDMYQETRTVVRPGVPVFVQAYDPRPERLVWLITAVVDVLLALRFIFMLLGASTQSAFVSLLYALTAPLVAAFQGMFGTAGHGGAVFDPASLVALVIYTLIGWVIVAAIRIQHSRRRPPP